MKRARGEARSARVATGALGLVFVAAALRAGVTAVAWAQAAQTLVYFVAAWALLEMRATATPIGNVAAVAPEARGLGGGET